MRSFGHPARTGALALLLTIGVTGGGVAQAPFAGIVERAWATGPGVHDGVRARPVAPGFAGLHQSLAITVSPPQEAPSRASLAATGLSALLPGAGQWRLGQRRAWVYLGLEAVGWGLWVDRRGAGAELRTRYRDFAWEEGRIRALPREDGDFDFYETMSKWDRSGAFDSAPTSGLQPETDPATYNGMIWRRALGIHAVPAGAGPGDPRYEAALGYYRDRSYGEAFLWDWSADPTRKTAFGGLIERSDDRFRQATNALGFVIANHVVSAIDAFVSSRGRGVVTESRVMPAPGGHGVVWATSLRWPR